MDKPLSSRSVDPPLFLYAFGFAILDIVLTGTRIGGAFFCILSGVVAGWFHPLASISIKNRDTTKEFHPLPANQLSHICPDGVHLDAQSNPIVFDRIRFRVFRHSQLAG